MRSAFEIFAWDWMIFGNATTSKFMCSVKHAVVGPTY